MSGANGGKGEQSFDSYGIMRAMSPDGRRLLAEAVRRHREYRGWSRERVAAEGGRDVAGPPISPSTVKNVENPEKAGDIEGRTAAAIERAFDWPSGTVASILSGSPAPEPGHDPEQETPSDEDDRAWATFLSWPKDVKDAATYFGSLLATHHSEEKRRQLADQAFRMLLRSPL
jgi:hypothetical protein